MLVARQMRDHILDVSHPDRIIERIAIDRKAGMRGIGEDDGQLVQRRFDVNRGNIGPRHHHIADTQPVESLRIGQQGALRHRSRVCWQGCFARSVAAAKRTAETGEQTSRLWVVVTHCRSGIK